MKREKNLQDLADTLAAEVSGGSLSGAHEKKICVQCKKPAGKFRDELGRAGYELDGLCQSCQDEFFD